MKKITIKRTLGIIDCVKIKPSECSDMMLSKLEPALKLKLKSINGSIVNGHINIDHGYGHFVNKKYIGTNIIERGHTIDLNIYESDNEFPAYTTLKRPAVIPTKKQIEDLLK